MTARAGSTAIPCQESMCVLVPYAMPPAAVCDAPPRDRYVYGRPCLDCKAGDEHCNCRIQCMNGYKDRSGREFQPKCNSVPYSGCPDAPVWDVEKQKCHDQEREGLIHRSSSPPCRIGAVLNFCHSRIWALAGDAQRGLSHSSGLGASPLSLHNATRKMQHATGAGTMR